MAMEHRKIPLTTSFGMSQSQATVNTQRSLLYSQRQQHQCVTHRREPHRAADASLSQRPHVSQPTMYTVPASMREPGGSDSDLHHLPTQSHGRRLFSGHTQPEAFPRHSATAAAVDSGRSLQQLQSESRLRQDTMDALHGVSHGLSNLERTTARGSDTIAGLLTQLLASQEELSAQLLRVTALLPLQRDNADQQGQPHCGSVTQQHTTGGTRRRPRSVAKAAASPCTPTENTDAAGAAANESCGATGKKRRLDAQRGTVEPTAVLLHSDSPRVAPSPALGQSTAAPAAPLVGLPDSVPVDGADADNSTHDSQQDEVYSEADVFTF